MGLLGRANKGQIAVHLQEVEICVHIVRGRHSIQDEVETAHVLAHLVAIS